MTEEELKETPLDMLARADALRKEADEIRCAALRAALARTSGMVGPAAELLGMSRHQVHDILRREYPALGKEARAMREQAGYRGGNPLLYKDLRYGTK